MKSSPAAVFPIALALSLGPGSLEAVDFQKDIRPILDEKCFKCHSGPKAEGGLRMDRENTFSQRIGGDDPVIEPGNPDSSLLAIKAGLPRSDGDAMPPPPARRRGDEPMTGGELELVKKWIAEGASFEVGGSEATESATAMEEKSNEDEEPEFHLWSDVKGREMEAAFVALDGDTVKLNPRGKEPLDVPLAALSPDSQALARELAGDEPGGETATMEGGELHVWTNTEGKTLEAAFVSLDGENVKLNPADQDPFDYPLENLDDESQALARELAEE